MCFIGIHKFINHASKILHKNTDWVADFVKDSGLKKEWKKIKKKEDDPVEQLYDILEAWFKKDPKQHTIERLKYELKDVNVVFSKCLIQYSFVVIIIVICHLTKEFSSIETDSSSVHKKGTLHYECMENNFNN